MTDHVRGALGRFLGISERNIALWRLTCGAGSHSDSRFGAYNAPTRFEAEIEVEVDVDDTVYQKFRARFLNDEQHGLTITEAQPYERLGQRRLTIKIRPLYGKDTQHLFKALAKMAIWRGPHKGKGR